MKVEYFYRTPDGMKNKGSRKIRIKRDPNPSELINKILSFVLRMLQTYEISFMYYFF